MVRLRLRRLRPQLHRLLQQLLGVSPLSQRAYLQARVYAYSVFSTILDVCAPGGFSFD